VFDHQRGGVPSSRWRPIVCGKARANQDRNRASVYIVVAKVEVLWTHARTSCRDYPGALLRRKRCWGHQRCPSEDETEREGRLSLSCSAHGALTEGRTHEPVAAVATIDNGRLPPALESRLKVLVHDCTYRHHRRRDRWCRGTMSKYE